MPYIPKDDRTRVASEGATNPGELNYELTLAIRAYLRQSAPLKYAHVNHVVSAIELAKQTFRCPRPAHDTLYGHLFRICERYAVQNLKHDALGYATTNPEFDALGALECCKLEFYRRVAVPYEDRKIKSNGDVYT